MNKIGACDWYMLMPGTAAIRHAGKLGYDGIQISDLGGAARNFPFRDQRIREEFRQAAIDAGIEINAFHNLGICAEPGLQFPMGTPESGKVLESFQVGLLTCRDLGIPAITVPSFRAANFSCQEEMQNVARHLKHMAKLAADVGVELAYEPFCDTDKLEWIMAYVGEGMRVVLDTQNPVRDKFGDPIEIINRLGIESLSFVHLKDSPEDLVGCCILGEGVCRVNETMQLLMDKGYDGWFFDESYLYLPPLCYEGPGLDISARHLAYIKRFTEKNPL